MPESTLGAGHRLMLHGLAVECLHAYLVKQKRLREKVRSNLQRADGENEL